MRKTDSKVRFRSILQTVVKKECRRNISFEPSFSEDENTRKMICQDDELDDIDPKTFTTTGAARSEELGSNDNCMLCGEFGKDKECWFRCSLCSGWMHEACSAAENFICDFGQNN